MKDKRHYQLPSNQLLRRHLGEIVELLEFHVMTDTLNTWLINIAKVHKVFPRPQLLTSHQGQTPLIGSVHLQGQAFALYSLARLLGHASIEKEPIGQPTMLIELSGSCFALTTHDVSRIHYVPWEQIKDAQTHTDNHSIGLVHVENNAFPMIDLEALMQPFLSHQEHTFVEHKKPLSHYQSLSIAVIDDSFTARKHITETLRHIGYQVKPFSSAPAFLRSFEKSPQDYHLIITDVEMPGMSGVELTHKIREKYETPIIILSSIDDQDLRLQTIKHGASEWFTKNNTAAVLQWIEEQEFMSHMLSAS